MRVSLLLVSALVCFGAVTALPVFQESMIGDGRTSICDPSVVSYAGYYALSSTKNYFSWFFESRSNPKTDPVLLWLTGGPGCSSELALFYENGPCSIASNLSTVVNPYGWNSFANLLYVDQPTGTGFSYGAYPGDYDKNEDEVADDLYNFIQLFLTNHPEYANNDFFVFGESYAGHYVPAISYKIFTANQGSSGKYKINLKGFAIGNGLTDPEIQYKYYTEYAYSNPVKPLITEAQYKAQTAKIPACTYLIHGCQTTNLDCTLALDYCNAEIMSPPLSGGENQYDISKNCTYPPLCYDFSNLDNFLALNSTRTALGVGSRTWSQCNDLTHEFLNKDWMKNYQDKIPPLLESGIRGLIYAGENDFVCNYKGNKAWTLALPWSGQTGFNNAADHEWLVAGSPAATARTYGNFTFLQVHHAGHMVPLDQPANSLEMVRTFLNGLAF